MSRLLTLAALCLFTTKSVLASPCVAFDVNWNLLAFGFNGKDYNAGTQDTWGQGSATDITTSGRPPFDGANTTCYLAQFFNAIYIMGADKSNPSSVSIYDATAKSWSTQSVTTGSFDTSSFDAILDHDTNVFYALSNGELFSLDMGGLKAANSSALSWVDDKKAGFNTDGYQPVMALAENHIHFLDVPGVAAGSAMIFVIHFSFFQPEAQSYGNFPATHGQATSFFLDSGVQVEFAFIPDDGSATYVINVVTNTTQTLAGPSTKDPLATYFASTSSLVQLSSTGSVSFLPYSPNSTSANQAASWSPVVSLAGKSSGSSGTASATSAGASASGGASGTAKGSAAGSTATTSAGNGSAGSNTGGAEGVRVQTAMQLGLGLLLGAAGLLL